MSAEEKFGAPNDGDWKRWALRLVHVVEDAIHMVNSYRADYPDEAVTDSCNEFIIEAEAALKDD